MDTHSTEKDEVQQFSDQENEKKLETEHSDELGGYGRTSSDLSKNAYSSGPEDHIDEDGLVNEFSEKFAIDSTGDRLESSYNGVSDEVGSEPTDDVEDVEDGNLIVDRSIGHKTSPEGDVTRTVSGDATPEPSDLDGDSETVEVEGIDVENIEITLESSDDEDLEIPKIGLDSDEDKSKRGHKVITQKLKWEAKASIPKYAMTINSKLNTEDIQKLSITTKGKAEKLAQVKTEINQSKAKIVKDQFKKDYEDKKTADQMARAKTVEKERSRFLEAKKKKELAAEKLRKEAAERYRKEKELKEKEKLELELKRKEFNRAKVEAFKSSKNDSYKKTD